MESGVNVSVYENICLYGKITKIATKLDMRKHKGAWTGDHWISWKNKTYLCTTFHYIDDWMKINRLIDFQIFYGSTNGVILYQHPKKILELDSQEPAFVFIGIVDTVGSMGVLTQEYCSEGHKAGYCTEHNFHLNAILAFKGELF